jgi:SagB-type dehydrogenase family enzyme
MNRRRVRYLVNVLLLVAAIVVAVTGVIIDRLELHGFTIHLWAGYAFVALAAVHLAFHRHWMVPFKRAWGTARKTAPRRPEVERPPTGAVARRRTAVPRRSLITGTAAVLGAAVVGWWGRAASSPSPYGGGDVGMFYHRESSLGIRSMLRGVLDWGQRPAGEKVISGAVSTPLPAVVDPPRTPLVDTLRQRRSRRVFTERALTVNELSWIVSSATGVTSRDGRRAAPSGGALYPIETYVAAHRVEGIEPGLYHVGGRGRVLQQVRAGSVAGDLMVAGLGQDFLRDAPAVLVLSGVFQRSRWKYKERHYRFVCWEGGHISQNVYLAAEAAGLGACFVGSFLDGWVNDLLRVDGDEEAALGMIAVGAV